MASANRQKSDPVAWLPRVAGEEPERLFRFDFFRLVRLLDAARTDLPRVGTSRLPQDDAIRFSQRAFLGFAPSTLAAISWNEEHARVRLVGYFAGLFGPFGALPQAFTQYVVNQHRGQAVAKVAAESDSSRTRWSGTRMLRRPWDILANEVRDLPGLVRQLRDEKRRPASVRILGNRLLKSLPDTLEAQIANLSPAAFLTEPHAGNLLRELNNVLRSKWLADQEVEAELGLPVELTRLVDAHPPAGDDLAYLNRLLLEHAFPEFLKPLRGSAVRDVALEKFLDLFHHRLLALFYRAWAVNQKAVDADRPDNPSLGERQQFPRYIGSLFGHGMDSLRNRDSIPDYSRLYYAGVLASQSRSAENLRGLLQDFFELPTVVEEFIGRWIALPASALCRLGASPTTGSLGSTAVAGESIWDCQMTFRIRMGPMGWRDFQRMLPCGDSFTKLRCWVRSFVGETYFWDLQLVLKAAEVPQTKLGTLGQLGWSTWLITSPPEADVSDLVVEGSATINQ